MGIWIDNANDIRVTGAQPLGYVYVCCKCMHKLTAPFYDGLTQPIYTTSVLQAIGQPQAGSDTYCKGCALGMGVKENVPVEHKPAHKPAAPIGDDLEKRVYGFFAKSADPAYCCGGTCLRSQCDYHRDAPAKTGKWAFAHSPEVLERIEQSIARWGRRFKEVGPNRFVVDGVDVWSWDAGKGWVYGGTI